MYIKTDTFIHPVGSYLWS